jgi:hypothetical protein
VIATLVSILTAAVAGRSAEYHVKLVSVNPPRVSVRADLPIDGNSLTMDTTRPGNQPDLNKSGWPALVTKLDVRDENGREVATSPAGAKGWQLDRPLKGRMRVRYEVDFRALSRSDWPAPREAAFADSATFTAVGRSLFVTTPSTKTARVVFEVPRGWKAIAPWKATVDRGLLVNNLIAFTRRRTAAIAAGNMRVRVVATGKWRQASGEVDEVLRAVVPLLARSMELPHGEEYLVVLLPQNERGGESFTRSFAMTFDAIPSRANASEWGNTIAHEIFHTWNGWTLRPADYAASQWFQEGFTEYTANVALLRAGIMTPAAFVDKLAVHVKNYARLETPLGAAVDRKGPPLYSAGALVAFAWDLDIRAATQCKRDLGDFLRELGVRTDGGTRPYTRQDIRDALAATASGEWDSFFASHLEGNARLPLESILAKAGLRLTSTADGTRSIEIEGDFTACFP